MANRSDSLLRQVDFLCEIEKLKGVARANRTLDGRRENSAEHSWHVALMALLLQEHATGELDMLKVVSMLLIHDIVEIDVGDTWLYDQNRGAKSAAEEQAAERLYALLPPPQHQQYLALWREFEARESAEARYAAAIDGIQPLLNHLLTGSPRDGVIPLDKVRSRKAYIEEHAPGLWDLVEKLIQKSTERGLYV